jgi:hypothetical protein
MNFLEFLSPLRRRKLSFLIIAILWAGLIWFALGLIPQIQKTTVYFSLKPIVSTETNMMYSFDPPESASKVAEGVSGWAKNPAFREQILQEAGVSISKFKKKLTARKQNRVNVFWTIKLQDEEMQHAEKLTQALITTFESNFADFNKDNSAPFGISEPQVFRYLWTFPFVWKLCSAIILGLVLSFLCIYFFEALSDRISFASQIRTLFPGSPLLRMARPIGKHDVKLLEQFILTFESPRLIGTFPKAEQSFSLAPMDTINEDLDIPILLVKLGTTKMTELENMLAIFGDEIGIIVFEK